MGIRGEFKRMIKRTLHLEREIIAKPESLQDYSPLTALVIAPHSDDEVLGCGGLLLELLKKNCQISFLIVTNGREGTAFTSLRGDALIQARERETRAAAQILRVAECYFLREEDTRVDNTESLRHKIEKVLAEVSPELILLPYLYDSHADHRSTAAATLQVLNDARFTGQILMYEVWTPLPANKVISIDWEQKLRLIRQYETQLGEEGFYVDGTKSLARYRAMTARNDHEGYAECYLQWALING